MVAAVPHPPALPELTCFRDFSASPEGKNQPVCLLDLNPRPQLVFRGSSPSPDGH